MTDIHILGIESSCDETAAAVVRNGRAVLSNVIHSQIPEHRPYGGVVPEIASRNHVGKITEVVDAALREVNMSLSDIDAVAVTYGPGLVGALLVGLSFAKAMAFAARKPLIGVHHIMGHIYANYLSDEAFAPPFVCLVVSGGHTHLIRVTDDGVYEILGKTRDDAAGEAFDKVARALGLPYPGGVEIDRLAKTGDATAFAFPRVMLESDSLDFSFSGLKSAVLNELNSAKMQNITHNPADVAASFQRAVVDVLAAKAVAACKTTGLQTLALAGGVSCNTALRTRMAEACAAAGIALHIPAPVFCTDNAAMIAAAGFYEFKAGRIAANDLNAYPNLTL